MRSACLRLLREEQISYQSLGLEEKSCIQHAVAMKLFVELLVVENYPLDEAIIKYTHRLLMKLSEYEETGGVYRESDEVATHGARFETDLEYERRVRDVKRRKLNQPPPQRMVEPLFFSKFVCGALVPIYIEKIVEQYAKDTERAEEREGSFM